MDKSRAMFLIGFLLLVTILGLVPMLSGMKIVSSGEEVMGGKSSRNVQTILIIFKKKHGDIFDDKAIKELYYVKELLTKIPGVVKIDSILDAEKIEVRFGINVKRIPYFPNHSVSEFSREILKNKLYVGNLISPDGNVVSFAVSVDKNYSPKIVEDINYALKNLERDFEVYMTGEPVVDLEINHSVKILAFLYPPILFGMIWFIYFLRLGNVVAAILPPLISVVSVIWTYEIATLFHISMNILTATVGIFVIIISSSYGLHFLDRYVFYRKYHDLKTAVKKSIESERTPIILSAVTTAVAFISFVFAPLKGFKELGVLVATGVMLSALSSLYLTIPVVSLLNIHRIKKRVLNFRPRVNSSWRFTAYVITALVVAIFSLTFGKIEVNMDEYKYFKKSSKIRIASEISNRYFGWTLPLHLILKKSGSFTMEDQKNLEKIEKELENLKGISGVMSAVDLSKELHVPIPILQILSERYRELSGMIGKGYVDMMVKTPYTGTLKAQSLLNDIERVIKKYGYSYEIKGPLVSMVNANSGIVKSQVISLSLSFLFIFLLLLGVFRRFSLSILATVPVILTSLSNFIVMAIFNIPLEISTVIVAGLLMGLVIDYAIHFTSKYVMMKDIGKVVEEISSVILSNSLGLALGFATLLFAPLALYERLGFLMSVGIALGAVYTILVIPPLLENVKIR